jgi:ATP adenylyltransferase
MNCPFCNSTALRARWISWTDVIYVIHDKYPVTEGHMLLIPFRHVVDYFDMNIQEQCDMNKLFTQCASIAEKLDPTICGWNIGTNIGEAAGQTVMHCHVHMIPRRLGDVEAPQGGIRGCIPHKMSYE